MTDQSSTIHIAAPLISFVENEVLVGQSLDKDAVWQGLAELIEQFMPRNQALLAERDRLQTEIDTFHIKAGSDAADPAMQHKFLKDIGYLAPNPSPFKIQTRNVDVELAVLSGPQIVVPVDNARYALNAANARWGSLYDALYGTDALGSLPESGPYDLQRGAEVIEWAKAYLDDILPLVDGSHRDVDHYSVKDGLLVTKYGTLKQAEAFRGYRGNPESPEAILLAKNELHLEIQFDRNSPVGRQDKAGICDVLLESAVSAIMDFEDAVAAVDAHDKVAVYRNWLGLMQGTLEAEFEKDGRSQTRHLAPDRQYTSPHGTPLTLKGRALMLVRNVGHLMTTPLVTIDGRQVPEGIVDAFITALIGRHDVNGRRANSKTGSIYVVKPKMHGPEETAFARDLFAACETIAGLSPNTMKIGVMDEERRTSLNLEAVIAEVKERIVFTNTGFLDRTGDEIHTAMNLGPVLRKSDMKSATWLMAYENNNVDVSLKCGFAGQAQIGKGMWTMPDLMRDMLAAKITHPMSGANTAWVPSPNGGTLHSTHYHQVNVFERQNELASRGRASLDDILHIPLLEDPSSLTDEQIKFELDNNAQGILGYVVRWIDAGVGCSKVPDINNVGLMEDRATLRISSQHLANWLEHGICTEDQVMEAMTAGASGGH